MKNILAPILMFIILLYTSCDTSDYNVYIEDSKTDTIFCNSILKDALGSSTEAIIDDIVDTVVVIKLETKEESLIGNIRDVSLSTNYIYVLDYNGAVLIFDKKGMFVKSLNKGQGPGEVIHPQCISYNKDLDAFFVSDLPGVSKFASCGEYLETYYNVSVHSNIVSDGNSFYILQNLGDPEFYKESIIKVDSNFTSLQSSSLPLIRKMFRSFCPMTTSPDGGIYYNRPIDNRIYWYYNDTLRLKYLIDYSDYMISLDNCDVTDFAGSMSSDGWFFSGNFVETSNYQKFNLESKNDWCIIFRNKNTSGMRCLHTYTPASVCTGAGIPVYFSQPHSTYDDYFVGIMAWEHYWYGVGEKNFAQFTANACISQEDVDKIKTHTPDDNPLIVLYKLKDIPADTE